MIQDGVLKVFKTKKPAHLFVKFSFKIIMASGPLCYRNFENRFPVCSENDLLHITLKIFAGANCGNVELLSTSEDLSSRGSTMNFAHQKN